MFGLPIVIDHCEIMDRMGLNQDGVMIIHMGGEKTLSYFRDVDLTFNEGTFGDKAATLARFRTNYGRLPENVKGRLVLENDEVYHPL